MAIIYATWLSCKWNMKDRKGEGVANSEMLVLQYYFMVLNHHVFLLQVLYMYRTKCDMYQTCTLCYFSQKNAC